jgi:hypothetical protein
MSETNLPIAKSDAVTLKVTRHMNGTHKFVTKEDAMAVPGSSFVVGNVEGVQVVGPACTLLSGELVSCGGCTNYRKTFLQSDCESCTRHDTIR